MVNYFFGEKSFNIEYLTRIIKNGKGIILILRLADIQDKPKLFSTFILQLLFEMNQIFTESFYGKR
ncbi:MAG: hypothetical protein ABS28_03745 [Cryomorphaceae bacterium BACL22 MAG-120619-bin32]|nr:MAG: hypothetical protein ABS28_03745 [Cryomorphaceae bacterium BACL22 MAG-120619-bin32]